MRALTFAAPTALLLALAGCASTMDGNRYNDEVRQLAVDCAARGGILAPTGQQSGRPQIDNVCQITGGATRLPEGGG